ncbi:hypothetical protein [Vaccinium witches'-broom phytoplasma]|uniref:hypothetical protein n=1 Tax=Vaccinium witches'-broom phytoplasma TaxID=85642 RepID=UPI00035C54B8|nr:hypothetical protein [Vaccinium witches'-broom phytoplasma]
MKKQKLKLFNKLYFGLLAGILLVLGSLAGYYYITKEPDKSNKETTQEKAVSQSGLDQLTDQIKFYEQKLKETSDAASKETLQQIIDFYQKQKENLEKKNLWEVYSRLLEEEIKNLDQKLKNETHKLTAKHTLTAKKLQKEKELIALQEQEKLLTEEEEIENTLLPDIANKLKNPDLKEEDKKKIIEEKTRLTTKLDDTQKQISKMIQKIKIIQEINHLEKEITETAEENYSTHLLNTRKEQLQTQLETLN